MNPIIKLEPSDDVSRSCPNSDTAQVRQYQLPKRVNPVQTMQLHYSTQPEVPDHVVLDAEFVKERSLPGYDR